LRHVAEYTPPVALQPTQGWLPVLKLDWQPPTQLFVLAASWASFATSEFGAADAVVGEVATTLVLRAVARCVDLCGLAISFGASTVMPGSWVSAGVGCDFAVPPRPHSSKAIDGMATAQRGTKRDDDIMAISFQRETVNSIPGATISHARSSCILASRNPPDFRRAIGAPSADFLVARTGAFVFGDPFARWNRNAKTQWAASPAVSGNDAVPSAAFA
jgi:hypothetical protein